MFTAILFYGLSILCGLALLDYLLVPKDFKHPFRRMPTWLSWILAITHGDGTWMTTPWGVLVPPRIWDSGMWSISAYRWVRDHELVHWANLK